MPNCRLCENDGETVEATRRVDGTDVCGECATSLERADIASVPVRTRVSDGEALLAKLNALFDKALTGKMAANQINAACNVSSEMLKLLALQNKARRIG